ncbi:MAG: hypothetical protein PVG82_07445 [Chromatiales bacterium]
MTLLRAVLYPTGAMLLVVALTACGPRDLAVDRSEWSAMSPEERAAVQSEYQEMLDQKETLRQRERIRGQTRTLSNRGLGVRPESNNPVKDCCI